MKYKKSMKNNILLIIGLFIITNSFGQLEISGSIYRDSIFMEKVPKVTILLKSGNKQKKYKTDYKEEFRIFIENPRKSYSLQIKKRGYTDIIINDVKVDKLITTYKINAILRERKSMHDEDYEGKSELLLFEKTSN